MTARMFGRILIANRGEIACRIMRTARRLGVSTVAVYSDADRDAPHVGLADMAVHIGGSTPAESYLNIDRILGAANSSHAEAIHPGYGFLSENAVFRHACDDAGIVFIGPPATAIEAMGSKSAAKRIMEAAGVPLLPGYHGEAQDDGVLARQAQVIGYPVLLKAVAGGGGRGMRLVEDAAAFDRNLSAARREAQNAFGDQKVLVEKYLREPRHVEVQIFSDSLGNSVYLFERDCSVQRRHQKVIEEAPAPGVNQSLRERMGRSAIKAAEAIDYRGAGTVEFLVDDANNFYFMEMNTRLQVEHPVTECITGQDLVEWQLKVACGEPLPVFQDQLAIDGHAFEARIYAEDPDNDFSPATGKLSFFQTPIQNQHVRVDSGVVQGNEISPYYDALVAKLIAWGATREQALTHLRRALADFHVGGVTTNAKFLYKLVGLPAFAEGCVTTDFIEQHRNELLHCAHQHSAMALPFAALYVLLLRAEHAKLIASRSPDPWSPWNLTTVWRLNGAGVHHMEIILNGEQRTLDAVELSHCEPRRFRFEFEGRSVIARGALCGDTLHAELNGYCYQITVSHEEGSYQLFTDDAVLQFSLEDEQQLVHDRFDDASLCAPMNATVVSLLAKPGEPLAPGDPVMIVEAMKMEHTLTAPTAGHVAAFHYQVGDRVEGGVALLEFVTNGSNAE